MLSFLGVCKSLDVQTIMTASPAVLIFLSVAHAQGSLECLVLTCSATSIHAA